MSILSQKCPFSIPFPFRYGRPLPNSSFSDWISEDSKLLLGQIHPLKVSIHISPDDGFPDFKRLGLSGHSFAELSGLLSAIAEHRDKNLSYIQDDAIATFHDICHQQLAIMLPGSFSSAQHDCLIRQVFLCLDELFFLGTLQVMQLCKLEICNPGQIPGFKKAETIHPGSKLERRMKIPDGYAAVIRIVDRTLLLNSTGSADDIKACFNKEVQILLHEMIHAFFGIFGCMCKDCYSLESCGTPDGHGLYWQNLALAIEKATEEHFGTAISLDRLKSLQSEPKIHRKTFRQAQKNDIGF